MLVDLHRTICVGTHIIIVEQFKHTDTMNELIHNLIEIDNYVPQKVNFDIFISYRRADGREYARNIQLGLQQRGSTFNVFLF